MPVMVTTAEISTKDTPRCIKRRRRVIGEVQPGATTSVLAALTGDIPSILCQRSGFLLVKTAQGAQSSQRLVSGSAHGFAPPGGGGIATGSAQLGQLGSVSNAEEHPHHLGRLQARVGGGRRDILGVLVAETGKREEHAVLQHAVEAALQIRGVVQGSVLRLIDDAAVQLDAQIVLVTGRLHELAGARPNDLRAATEAHTGGLTDEVVLGRGLEEVAALDARQDVAVQDQVDAVAWMKAERLERAITDLRLGRAGRWHQALDVVVTRRPARVEGQLELILDELLLELQSKAPLVDLPAVTAARGVVVVVVARRGLRAVEAPLMRDELEARVELLVFDLAVDVRRPLLEAAAGEAAAGLTRLAVDGRGAVVAGGSGPAVVVGDALECERQVEASVHDDPAAGQDAALELRIDLAKEHQVHRRYVVVLGEVVRLAAGGGERRAGRSFVREIPSATGVEGQGFQAAEERDAVDRRLVVAVDVVAGIVLEAEAPVVGHATEAGLPNRCLVLAPGALDRDAVLDRVDAADRRALAPARRAHRVVATTGGHFVAGGGGKVAVALSGRAEDQVIEQVDLAANAQVVGDDDSGLDAEAHVAARLRRVAAGLIGIPGAVAVARGAARFERRARGRAVALAVQRFVVVVERAGPIRRTRRVDATEGELMVELGAHPEVAVQLDGRTRVRPPVLGEEAVRILRACLGRHGRPRWRARGGPELGLFAQCVRSNGARAHGRRGRSGLGGRLAFGSVRRGRVAWCGLGGRGGRLALGCWRRRRSWGRSRRRCDRLRRWCSLRLG